MNSLRLRLLAYFLSFSSGLTLMILVFVYWQQQKVVNQIVYQSHGEIVAGLGDRIGEALNLGNHAMAEMLLQNIVVEDPMILWAVVSFPEIDAPLKVPLEIDLPHSGRVVHTLDAKMALAQETVMLVIDRPQNSPGTLRFSLPLFFQGKAFGSLWVGVDQDRLDRMVWHSIYRVFGFGVLLLGASILPGLYFFQRVLQPLWRLQNELAPLANLEKVDGETLAQFALGPRYHYKELDAVRAALQMFIERLKESFALNKQYMNREIQAKRWDDIVKTTQFLAHDIRKPFSQIKAFAARMEQAKPGEYQDLVQTFLSSVHLSYSHVTNLLDEIMEFRPGTTLARESLGLRKIVKETVGSLGDQEISTGQVQIRYQFGHLNNIKGDRLALKRVLLNLLVNALEKMPGKGVITIRSRQVTHLKGDRIKVTVHNTHSYVPTTLQEKIFEPFVTQNPTGTGLGLAYCRKVIEEFDGKIFCSSSTKTGTSFVFDLPAAAEVEEGGEVVPLFQNAPNQGGQGSFTGAEGVIFFADDDPWLRLVWEESEMPGPVFVFAEPDHLLDNPDLPRAALIILDFHFLPGQKNGAEIAKELRVRGYQGVILIASDGIPAEADLTGVDGTIAKLPDEARATVLACFKRFR